MLAAKTCYDVQERAGQFRSTSGFYGCTPRSLALLIRTNPIAGNYKKCNCAGKSYLTMQVQFFVCLACLSLMPMPYGDSVNIKTVPATIGTSGEAFKVTGRFTSTPTNENDTRVIGVEMLSAQKREVAGRVPKSIGVETSGDFDVQLRATEVDEDSLYLIYVFLAKESELFNSSIKNPTKFAETDSKSRIRIVPSVTYQNDSSPDIPPTPQPTEVPTMQPSQVPTRSPTISPTYSPTVSPSVAPTVQPTVLPTASPTIAVSPEPTSPEIADETDMFGVGNPNGPKSLEEDEGANTSSTNTPTKLHTGVIILIVLGSILSAMFVVAAVRKIRWNQNEAVEPNNNNLADVDIMTEYIKTLREKSYGNR